jgi:nucleoid DNA-binding protein
MSLLLTDLSKVKKLSLRGVRLPIREIERKATIKALTSEEIAYNKLLQRNPLIEKLVEKLDLVSNTTGERIKKVNIAHIKPEVKAQEIDNFKLIALAQRIIERENSYTKDEVIDKIKEATNVSQERAEKGLNLILQAGAIEIIPGERYIIKGSTPF